MLSNILNQITAIVTVVMLTVGGWFGFTNTPNATTPSQAENQEIVSADVALDTSVSLQDDADSEVVDETTNFSTKTETNSAIADASDSHEEEKKAETFSLEDVEPRIRAALTLYDSPPFPLDQNLKVLLTSLRNTTSHSNVRRPLPSDACVSGTNTPQEQDSGTLAPAPGLYFDISALGDGGLIDSDYLPFVMEVHAYDDEGGHIGLPAGKDPSSEWYPLVFPEDYSSKWDLLPFGSSYYFNIDEFFDGKLVIKGKSYDYLSIGINGEGNRCGVVEHFLTSLTPYSTIVLPITSQGDIGPMHYDVNSDGTADFDVSLVYEMSADQMSLFSQVVARLKELQ